MHGEHQEHLRGPATDAPQLGQLGHYRGIIGMGERLLQVQHTGVDRVCESLDGLGLRAGQAHCPQVLIAGGHDSLGGDLPIEVVGDLRGDRIGSLDRDLLGDHRTHQGMEGREVRALAGPDGAQRRNLHDLGEGGVHFDDVLGGLAHSRLGVRHARMMPARALRCRWARMRPVTGIIEELLWRELIADSTDLGALREATDAGSITLYCGFDPTAPSLHLGNLAQILTVRRFQQHGHRPLALVGGATGLIGDPKESGERTLNAAQTVEQWVARIRGQLERFYEFSGENAAVMVNNYDWTAGLSALEFLRDVGKHFSVNRMLDREAVSARLAKDGISYTEFSYQLLQSYDYLQLHRQYGCILQTGGSDQWGNITAGVDLVRRIDGAHVHALTTPLITKADGTKFGKTESGTVWLDPELTSPYAFFQFWLNADDRDIPVLLRTFSFKDKTEIDELITATNERPHERAAQRALAEELTELVHGSGEMRGAQAAGRVLFGQGEFSEVPEATLTAALLETPHGEVASEEIEDGQLPAIDELLVRAGLVDSKGAARRAVKEGGAYLNNERVSDAGYRPTPDDLVHGTWLVLRRGKRNVGGVRVR